MTLCSQNTPSIQRISFIKTDKIIKPRICETQFFPKGDNFMKNMTKDEYRKYIAKKSPRSRLTSNMLRAFLVGGLICTLGQGLNWLYLCAGLEEELASASASVSLIFLSALLTGLNIYDKIALFGLAGTLVSITGFANAMVSPALEYKSEGPVLGVGGHMFSIAGPVLMFGTVASFIYGVIYMLIGAAA